MIKEYNKKLLRAHPLDNTEMIKCNLEVECLRNTFNNELKRKTGMCQSSSTNDYLFYPVSSGP